MDMQDQDVLVKIQSSMKTFSKGQKKIANYLLTHYDKAAFMTAAKLGDIVGISESTVVRFASELGYDGYPKLQKALQELIRTKLTSVQRMQFTSNRYGETDVLQNVLMSDTDKIRQTLDEIDHEMFEEVVSKILSARRIYILGVRSSAALASFLGFYFNLMFENVRLVHTTSVSEMFEQIMGIREGDLVIGISFPRYSRRTVQALQYAHDQHAEVIALTDSKLSPLTKIADYALLARSDMASFVDSLVAPLSVINALIVALGMRRQEKVTETFERLEQIWEAYNVYEKQPEEENE